MKKRFLFLALLTVALICAFTVVASAAQDTSEFGSVESIPGIDLSAMNTEADKRVVIVDAQGKYHTYPANYIVSNNTKFYYNFKPINDALGTSYNKNSVIRIEVPDNIVIATNCGDLSQTNNLEEIKFSPKSQLTTLEYGCFYANKNLKKLNIPKNVTTIGTLIINNSHLEELIFDDGFSAVLPKDSFKGADGVRKVVFSNQMTTVEDRALDSTLGEELEEFYMGASLMDLGTNNMAWVKSPTKFYAPSQFLSKVDTLTMETFSWWDSQACLPTAVWFFAGTKEQAQALIDKATYERLVNTTLVEWDETKSDDSYMPTKGWTIVYGYNTCKAFYNNVHDTNGANSCVSVIKCKNCEKKLSDAFPDHKPKQTLTYANGFDKAGVYSCICANAEYCTAIEGYALNEETLPIITFLGYSVPETAGVKGINAGFKVDKDLLDDYNDINDVDATLTLFMVNCKSDEVNISKIFKDGTLNLETGVKGINVAITSTSYTNISVEVRGFDDSSVTGNYYTLKLITAIAVKTEEGTHFVQAGLKTGNDKQAVDGVDFNIVSAENVYSAVAE